MEPDSTPIEAVEVTEARWTETMEIAPELGEADRLMEPREAAAKFGVKTRTLRRWHSLGLISAQMTLGGKRRYWESEVRARVAQLRVLAAEAVA